MGFPTLFILVIAFQVILVCALDFNVGGEIGWVTPSPKDVDHYNDWASENRFQVNDTLNFKYEDDSVMLVTKEEYKKCRSRRPMFFSNKGDNDFKLDRPGFFYFISGVEGHCSRGLKMVVKVLDVRSPPQSADESSSTPRSHSAAIQLKAAFLPIIVPIVGGFFM